MPDRSYLAVFLTTRDTAFFCLSRPSRCEKLPLPPAAFAGHGGSILPVPQSAGRRCALNGLRPEKYRPRAGRGPRSALRVGPPPALRQGSALQYRVKRVETGTRHGVSGFYHHFHPAAHDGRHPGPLPAYYPTVGRVLTGPPGVAQRTGGPAGATGPALIRLR